MHTTSTGEGVFALGAHALPHFFTAIAIGLLGLFILVRERGSRVSWLFGLLALALSGWLFASAELYSVAEAGVARGWVKAHQVSVYFIPAAVYHLAIAVVRQERQHRRRALLGWLISGLFAGAALAGDTLAGPLYLYPWGYYPRYGWRNLVFLVYFAIMLLAGLLHYWRAYRQAAPGSTQRLRAQALMVAFAIGYVGSVDYLPAYGVPLYPIGFLPILVFVGITAHTVRRYRLVDITPAFAAHQILHTMRDAVLVFDQERAVRLANRAAAELFGCSEQALADGQAVELIGRMLPAERFAAVLRGEALAGYETEFEPPDGSGRRLVLNLSASVMADADRRPLAVVCVLRDVTERRQAEERVRREAARAQALVRVAARLNAELDLAAVMQAVCEETAQAVNVPVASLRLVDAAREAVVFAHGYGLPPEYGARARPLPLADYEAHMRQAGPIAIVRDLQALPGVADADLYAAFNMRTTASAVMRRESVLVGSLNVVTLGQVREFTADELDLLQGLANQAALAISNARLFAQARNRLEQLQGLRNIDKAITAGPDLARNLDVVLEQITTQLDVDAAAILLPSAQASTLEYVAGRGFRTEVVGRAHRPAGDNLAWAAAWQRQVIHQPAGSGAVGQMWPGEDFVASWAVPLVAKDQVLGVLEVYHRAPLAPDAEWVAFLETLAGQAAIAIDNAQLFLYLQRSNAELLQAYDRTLEGWVKALDLRDRETEGHTQRVAELAVRLARRLGFSEAELVHVRRGALLHDIGKMGIPDRILLKPGPLSEDEWVTMRQHPSYAHSLLAPIAYLAPALDIPYGHHERWDGSGYPRGLKGEQIPLTARLFAVVDVWDALRSDRPYRPGWPAEQIRAYLREQAGRQFDPVVVELFLDLLCAE